jgi:hypothetical protein
MYIEGLINSVRGRIFYTEITDNIEVTSTSSDAAYQGSMWQDDSVVSEVINSAIVFSLHYELDVLHKPRFCIKLYWKRGQIATEM